MRSMNCFESTSLGQILRAYGAYAFQLYCSGVSYDLCNLGVMHGWKSLLSSSFNSPAHFLFILQPEQQQQYSSFDSNYSCSIRIVFSLSVTQKESLLDENAFTASCTSCSSRINQNLASNANISLTISPRITSFNKEKIPSYCLLSECVSWQTKH